VSPGALCSRAGKGATGYGSTKICAAGSRPPIISTTSSLPQLPVIDLQSSYFQTNSCIRSELEKLHYTCKEWGFFQVHLYLCMYIYIVLPRKVYQTNIKERDKRKYGSETKVFVNRFVSANVRLEKFCPRERFCLFL
jgi:hypothetical protein